MNILDTIRNNQFIKKIYPNGISDFFIGNISLGIDSSITIALHSKEKPSIEISKWGKWGINYNIIVIEFSSFLPKRCDIINWESINKDSSNITINKNNLDSFEIEIISGIAKIIIETDSFLFQKCETYIL